MSAPMVVMSKRAKVKRELTRVSRLLYGDEIRRAEMF